jgi:hypothetical protein
MQGNPYYVDPTAGAENTTALLSGIGDVLQENRLRSAAIQEKKDAEDKALARQQAMTQAAQKAFSSGDPELMAQTALEYPEVSAMLKDATGLHDDQKNREALSFTRQFAMSDNAARPKLYEDRIKSIQARGGDAKDTIASYQDFMQNPDAEARDVIGYWAGIDPKGYSAYSDEQKQNQQAALAAQKLAQSESQFNRAEAGRNSRASRSSAPGTNGKPTAGMQDFQYYQQLRKDDPEAAKAFGSERGFISKEGKELSGHLQKRLSTATDDAISAERNVGKFTSLADEVDKSDISGGLLGSTWGEKLKDITGDQDAATSLRQQYLGVRASQVVANLPPGAASDPDVKMALSGFPSDNANKQQISGFLRGMAKIQQANADFNNYKAEYVSDKGTERGMLHEWKKQSAAPVTTPASIPAIGAIEDGHRYIGGNPADPSSWESQ